MNNFLKSILAVVLLATVFGVGFYFTLYNKDKAGNTVVDNTFGWKFPVVRFPITGPGELAYSDIRDPGGIPEGLPVRLKIPVINVNTAIEDALITPDGRMDVPQGSRNVAWFALGPHPGKVGSAVIGGHFGIRDGVPFVFYNLDKIKVGDKVYIEDDKGTTLAFIVRRIQLFDRDADATTVFTSDDGLAHLNLITCEGIWNRINDTYPERRVVFTDAIPTEGQASEAITPPTISTITFSRSLSVGAKGQDVVALQNALERKGLLTIPTGIAKGYFGSMTKVAVVKYQLSVGLPQTGYFGPLTRARLISESLALEKPLLPTTAIIVDEPVPSPSPVKRTWFIESLYETPKDALITSLLLISILLLCFKILSR